MRPNELSSFLPLSKLGLFAMFAGGLAGFGRALGRVPVVPKGPEGGASAGGVALPLGEGGEGGDAVEDGELRLGQEREAHVGRVRLQAIRLHLTRDAMGNLKGWT